MILRDYCRENKEMKCDLDKKEIILEHVSYPLNYETRLKSDKGGTYTLGDIWFMFNKQHLSASDYMAACNEAGFRIVALAHKSRLIKWLNGEKTDLDLTEEDDDTLNPPKRLKTEHRVDESDVEDDIRSILCQDIELTPQEFEEKDQITKMLWNDENDQIIITHEKDSFTTFSQDSGLSEGQILSLKVKRKLVKKKANSRQWKVR